MRNLLTLRSFHLLRSVGLWARVAVAFGAVSLVSGAINLDRITPVDSGQQIPAEDFFRPMIFSSPELNPAGTHVAALVSGGYDTHQLMIHELESGESQIVDGLLGYDVYAFNWLNEHRLSFSLSTEKYYGIALGAVDLKALRHPYAIVQNAGHDLVGIPQDSPLNPLVATRYGGVADEKGEVLIMNSGMKNSPLVNIINSASSYSLYKEIEESNMRAVVGRYPRLKEGISIRYGSDRLGNLSHAFSWDSGVANLYYFEDGKWRRSPIDTESLKMHGVGQAPLEIVASEHKYDGKPAGVHFVSLVDGAVGQEILRDQKYDFTGSVIWDRGTRSIVGLDYHGGTPKLVWFDEGYRALQAMFEQNFPQRIVRIVSADDSAAVFVLAVSSDRHPTAYHLVDLNKKSLGPLKSTRPWLESSRMSPMNIIKFKTAEGRPLDAYLTVPAGASKASPCPLIVLPHGGPWVRDYFGFDAEVQFLASRGYAVLQPNYRGSPGTNWMFPEADQWDFLKMHDDVTRATKTALRTKLFDPTRVAIMGGSFGAYLALSGGVHEPDLYRCVVGIAGVYDWTEVVNDRRYDQYSSGSYGRLVYKLGKPEEYPEKFHRMSPINYVENLSVPMFVAHGKDDPVAAAAESRRLVSRLKNLDKKHESLFVSREGHGMAILENRVELYTEIEAFLAKNL